MFGKKKELKYIKVSGAIVARGEYDASAVNSRPYTAVTIVDEQGEQLHFQALIIPKRLDDQITLNKPMHFIILRFRGKKGMVGCLLALETDGRKLLYLDEAADLIKSFTRELSTSYQVMKINTMAFAIFAVVGGYLCVGAAMLAGAVLGKFIGSVLAFAGVGLWGAKLLYPFVQWKAYAGLPEFEALLAAEGYRAQAPVSDKY
jgi:hypothetical protein